MKKTILISLFFSFVVAANAQKFPVQGGLGLSAAPRLAQPTPGGETTHPGVPPAAPTSFRTIEQTIGTTAFDLQSANGLGRRIVDLGDGHRHA